MESYKDLIVWQKAFALVPVVYRIADKLPRHEQFGLASQMRRAVISVASNIAEGKKRGTRKDFAQFLRIAGGSAAELETQCLAAEAVYRLDCQDALRSTDEIQRMLTGFIKKLE